MKETVLLSLRGIGACRSRFHYSATVSFEGLKGSKEEEYWSAGQKSDTEPLLG